MVKIETVLKCSRELANSARRRRKISTSMTTNPSKISRLSTRTTFPFEAKKIETLPTRRLFFNYKYHLCILFCYESIKKKYRRFADVLPMFADVF